MPNKFLARFNGTGRILLVLIASVFLAGILFAIISTNDRTDLRRSLQKESRERIYIDSIRAERIADAIILADSMYRRRKIVMPVLLLKRPKPDSITLKIRLPQIDTALLRRKIMGQAEAK